jgi:transposase
MIPVPSGLQVWLATGHTDMRKGFDGLAVLVQETLKRNPHSGHLFVFRGRRGGLIKVLWHDGQGMCLFAKRLERGRFVWPLSGNEVVTITPGIYAGKHRLAPAAAHLASDRSGMSLSRDSQPRRFDSVAAWRPALIRSRPTSRPRTR